ncbi:MAG: alpha/beta fold hydrolase [Burkholderiaceae bacterium]
MAAGGAWVALAAGAPGWQVLLMMLAIVHLHALVLAFEFMLLARVDPGPGIPRPQPGALLRAWWGEVWTGFRVFGWRQPFRAETVPDRPIGRAPGPRRGVLLVHGFVCNRGLWNPWMERFAAEGVPFIAVNLEPVFGSIDRYVPIIEQAVQRLHAAGHPEPLIVAHSMGGLAVRAWMNTCAGAERVHSIVTIGTPHHGTVLARFGLSRNARQMRRHSRWLAALQAAETPSQRALFTCYFGHCDNIVVPAGTATLPGADNRHVPGVAHVHLAFQSQVLDDVIARTAVAAGAREPIDQQA